MVSWLVTAGVLSAGSGILGAASAFAEPGAGPGPGGGSSRQVNGLGQSLGTPPPGSNRAVRPPRARPGIPTDAGSGNPALAAAPARRAAVAPQLVMPADRVPSLPIDEPDAVLVPVVSPAPAVAPTVLAPVPSGPVRATIPSPPAAGPTVAQAPASTTALDRPAVAMPRPSRLGLPAGVVEAALPRIDPVAMAGLIALLGLTAVGIFLGYRQARAGFVVSSMGTRYLR